MMILVFLLIFVVMAQMHSKRRWKAIKYGGKDNKVVRGHAVFACGCLLSPHGVQPCQAHKTILEAEGTYR